jgi:DNA-binding NarL/FixJ family response regulator
MAVVAQIPSTRVSRAAPTVMIRLVIADDHAMWREGLGRILDEQQDMIVVGEAADGRAAVALVKEKRPNVILLDISMPEKDGIEVTKDITRLRSPTKVLILTMHEDEHYALRAFRAGAWGYIVKQAKSDELLKAIRQVHRGRRYLSSEITTAFAERFLNPEIGRRPLENLTDRQFHVMLLLSKGHTNREIGAQLGIKAKTVDSHRTRILKKLRLRNNSDLTRYALHHGLLEE